MTDREWAIQRMVDLGWIKPGDADLPNFSFEAALIEYQQFHLLPVSGLLDAETMEHLQRLRFCGHPDQMVGELRAAPLPGIWKYIGSLPSVPDDQARAEIQRSFDRIARVCPAWGREAAPGEPSTVNLTATRIDGRNGVLADMYLPGPMPQNGRIDTSEIYTTFVPIPPGNIGFGNVMTHELCHWAGVGHLQTPNSLMNPTYNPSIVAPQPADIAALQGIYPGPPYIPPGTPTPIPPPTPTPTPVPPGDSVATYMDILNQHKKRMKFYQLKEVPPPA